jgi:hypothetical protein
MWARPALKKGANVPEEYKTKELLKDKKAMEEKAAEVSLIRSNRGLLGSSVMYADVWCVLVVESVGTAGDEGGCRAE